MRLLFFLLSAAFCSAFTVTDIHNPENAAERQNDEEDQILPVFLITFVGALLVNILTLDTDIQEEKVQVQGREHTSITLSGGSGVSKMIALDNRKGRLSRKAQKVIT